MNRVISRTSTRPARPADRTAARDNLEAEVADRNERIRELQAQVADLSTRSSRLSEQLALREADLRSLRTTVDERTACGERLTKEASARESLVRELQLQLGDRSEWAFRMVEELVQFHAGQLLGGEGDRPVEAVSALTAGIAKTAAAVWSVMDPQHLAVAVAKQIAEVGLFRHRFGSLQAELSGAREVAVRLETTLSEERRTRHRLEEAAKRDYGHLTRRLMEAIEAVIPPNATVLMVSRGDEALVRSNGRTVWHFPQAQNGAWAGYHPSDSAEAIAHLERLRANGAKHLVFPATARWWLDHYHDFRTHLHSRYRMVLDRDDTGIIFDVTEPAWRCVRKSW